MKQARFRVAAVALALTVFGAACGDDSISETTTTEPQAPITTQRPASPPEDSTGAGDFGMNPGERVEPAALDWGDIDFDDRRLFTVMSEIDTTFRTRAAEIWSEDYRLDLIPVAFAYQSGAGDITKMYVLHHPDGASLPGAARMPLDESLGLGDVYSIDVPDNVAARNKQVPFDFHVDIGGASTLLFFLPENDPFLSPQTWGFARFVVHEAFHRHQLIDSRWKEDLPDGREYPRDAENAALALLEDRVLAATDTAGDDEIRHRLAQFLTIRRARTEKFDLGNLETTNELTEGTARYVENRYAELNGRPRHLPGPTGLSDTISLEWLAFARFYDSGAMIGHAFERLGVDWKDAVAAGTALTDLAQEAVGDTDPTTPIEEAKAEFGYDEILAAVEASDLENAEFQGPAGGMGAGIDLAEILQCLADKGLPIDTDIDPGDIDTILNRIDVFDPEVSAALDSCAPGIMDGPEGAAPGVDPTATQP